MVNDSFPTVHGIQQEDNAAVFLYALPARVMMRKLFVIILYHIIL